MTTTTRAEHLALCKERALKELSAGTPENALISMMSDLTKHPETDNHAALMLTTMMMLGGQLKTHSEAKRHIEGFN